MSSECIPVINITTSKAVNIEDQRKNQQLPNRNRIILRAPIPGVSLQKNISSNRIPDVQSNPERRPSRSVFVSKSFAESQPDGFKRPIPSEEEEQFHLRTRSLLNDKSRPPKVLPVAKVSNDEARSRTETLQSAESIPAPPPTKKKKIKPQLSVPTSAGQVSSNWKGLRKSLGLKDRPKRIIKPVDTSKSVETSHTEAVSGAAVELPNALADTFVKTKSFSGLTKTVALDCEFVGIGPGAVENMLARVSIVNQFGHCVYDKFVKPTELVKDYRTHVSGVRPQDLKKGDDFKAVQKEVSEILTGRILVGHAVHHDLDVLLLGHPKSDIRDTSRYKPFRQICKGGTPSLKKLTANILGFGVQTGEHDSVQDAQATMRLYTMHKRQWESRISLKGKKHRIKQKKKPVELLLK